MEFTKERNLSSHLNRLYQSSNILIIVEELLAVKIGENTAEIRVDTVNAVGRYVVVRLFHAAIHGEGERVKNAGRTVLVGRGRRR